MERDGELGQRRGEGDEESDMEGNTTVKTHTQEHGGGKMGSGIKGGRPLVEIVSSR